MVYCMFEQSGTFKNEFKKLGIDAIDLDILNEFGETDRVIDLFAEIEKGYQGEPSVFDEVKEDDLIMSFFPCTRFECKVPLLTRTDMWQARNWNTEERLEYSRRTFSEVNDMYQLWCKMFLTTIRGGAKDDMRKPVQSTAYSDTALPSEARHNRQGPYKAGRLLRKAHPVLVCELSAAGEFLSREPSDRRQGYQGNRKSTRRRQKDTEEHDLSGLCKQVYQRVHSRGEE